MATVDTRQVPQAQAGTPRPGDPRDTVRQMEGQAQPPAPQQGTTSFTDWASI